MKAPRWIVAIGLVVVLALALWTWATPGRAPAVARIIAQRGGRLCMMLEGEDREVCAELAAVASALASRPAPSASALGIGGAR